MNTNTTVSGVERINDAGTRKHFDPHDAAPYWTRMITCHGGGQTVTLILHANRKEALDLTPAQSIEAGLAEMSNETLDALSNAIRAERQSRDEGASQTSQEEDEAAATAIMREKLVHPRDCPGVTVTEDDGEPPF